MYICFFRVVQVGISAFPESYKYVCISAFMSRKVNITVSFSHTRVYICSSSVIQICVHARPQSYKYVYQITSVDHICISVLLSHTSMYICFSSVIQVCISAFPQSYIEDILMFLLNRSYFMSEVDNINI